MVRAGKTPTVSDAAEAAAISRATAYRYFPTQEMLLAEVALFAVGGPLTAPLDETAPLPEAVASLVRRVDAWAFANEQPLRTLMRLSLDPASGVERPGHRREWIANVLSTAKDRMDASSFDRLARSLTLLMGIDPVIVMKDIAGASREEALDTLEWAARALVIAALGNGMGREGGEPAKPAGSGNHRQNQPPRRRK
jgi:AcrR family transcriptional regulator